MEFPVFFVVARHLLPVFIRSPGKTLYSPIAVGSTVIVSRQRDSRDVAASRLPFLCRPRPLPSIPPVASGFTASFPEDHSARAEALDGGCPRRRLDSNQHIFQSSTDVLDYVCVFRRYYPLNYGTFYISIPLWLAVIVDHPRP